MATARAAPRSAGGWCSRGVGPAGASVCRPDDGGAPERAAVAEAEAPPGGSPLVLVRLRKRPEFVALTRSGRRCAMPAFVLQAGPRPGDGGESGLGFTASRRVGKSVQRNRARRRLREAARRVLPLAGRPGRNYVIVARPAAVTWPFERLCDDLRTAIERLDRGHGVARPRSTPSSLGS
jgi:ribonuclease P protein component